MIVVAPRPKTKASRKPRVAIRARPMLAPMQKRAARGVLRSKRKVSSVPPAIAEMSKKMASSMIRRGFREAGFHGWNAPVRVLQSFRDEIDFKLFSSLRYIYSGNHLSTRIVNVTSTRTENLVSRSYTGIIGDIVDFGICRENAETVPMILVIAFL